MKPNSKKIKDFLESKSVQSEVKEIPESTRTSKEAAEAIGCSVSEIAKSIIFKSETGKPILVIASGPSRINEKTIGEKVGEKLSKASPEFVKEKTGFPIGGVPPIYHNEKIETFFDKDLLNFKEIWAAAGTPNSVFKIHPEELVRISDATVTAIS